MGPVSAVAGPFAARLSTAPHKSGSSDRYFISSIVYQSLVVERAFFADINRAAPRADLTILVDANDAPLGGHGVHDPNPVLIQ